MENQSKKILILGCGRKNLADEPRCQACSLSKWQSLLSPQNAIVTLDMDIREKPDIVATLPISYDIRIPDEWIVDSIPDVGDWMLKVRERFGGDFDVIVDCISHISGVWKHTSYLVNAKYLLAEGGSFYAYSATPGGGQRGCKTRYKKVKGELVIKS